MKVVLREPEFQKYLNSPEGEVGRYLRKKGRLVVRAAKRQVGVRTGALRSSIHMRHYKGGRFQYVKIGSRLKYALLHHEGSRPHMIYPNRAQTLKFVKRGQIMYAGVVRHQGTKANKYLTDNLILIKN